MSVGRFYILHGGKELASFVFEGTGAWTGPKTRSEIYIREGRQVRTLTAQAFGHDEVTVKLWFPNQKPEFFTLKG